MDLGVEENMKRRVFIGFGIFALIGAVVFAAPIAKSDLRTDCIVQDQQVVLNTYRDDTLLLSLKFSDRGMNFWQRGQKQPEFRNYTGMRVNTYLRDPKGLNEIVIFSDAVFLTQAYVMPDCYDAIKAKV